jgi:hypothetical protein
LIRINVGGLAAQEIADRVAQIGGDAVEVHVGADIAGAQEVAQGKADYYLGACATGGGGALSMAIAILGYSNCFTASTAGRPPREKEIQEAVNSGKRAFGFATDHIGLAVPLIMQAILAIHLPRG